MSPESGVVIQPLKSVLFRSSMEGHADVIYCLILFITKFVFKVAYVGFLILIVIQVHIDTAVAVFAKFGKEFWLGFKVDVFSDSVSCDLKCRLLIQSW